LLFLPQPIASFAAAAITITQRALVGPGNYAWLHWATILLPCAGRSDSFFRWIAGAPSPAWGRTRALDTVTGAGVAGARARPARARRVRLLCVAELGDDPARLLRDQRLVLPLDRRRSLPGVGMELRDRYGHRRRGGRIRPADGAAAVVGDPHRRLRRLASLAE